MNSDESTPKPPSASQALAQASFTFLTTATAPEQSKVSSAARTLKIEAEGDGWKGRFKPKIRLIGRWLERAGFTPGDRVQVTHIAPGVLQLRACEAAMLKDATPPDGFHGP